MFRKACLNGIVAAAVALCTVQAIAAHDDVATAPRIPFSHGMGFIVYTSGTRSELTTPSTYMGLAEKGFDYVRIPVDFRNCSSYNNGVCTLNETNTTVTTSSWWGGGQTTTYLGFSSLDAAIDCAEAAGLYVILGFGNWNEINATNASHVAQFKATWRAVAERYRNRSNRLVFELADKIASTSQYASFNTLQQSTISIIRETNPTRLILFSVLDSSTPWILTVNDWWVSPPVGDNNVAVSVTCFKPEEFCNQGYSQVRLTSGHLSDLNWNLQQLGIFKTSRGFPVVLTEFNVNHTRADHGDVTQFLSTITRYCEANAIPWSPWMYYTSNNGKNCCNSDGSLIDYVKAGLFPDLTTVDDFTPASYEKSVEITFSGYSGTTALANFPALVKLSEAEIYGFSYDDFKKADGSDLCFTDESGNLLAHEVDTWNPSGESTVWVKVPSLTSSTKIFARYGCDKPVLPKVESVWDSNYVGVWHMGERKLPLADSSNVSRDLTSADGSGIGYGSAGAVGGAVEFGAANSSRCVNADDHNALDGFAKITVEAWTKQTYHTPSAGIVSKRRGSGSGGSMSYYMYDSGEVTAMCYSPDGSSVTSAGVVLSPVMGEWNHQAFTLDTAATSSNSKGYLNGELKGIGNVSCPGGIYAGAGELHVGNLQSDALANFPGSVDEVRISKCVRSADWIKASYDTVAKSRFANYVVLGADGHNPTLYVDVAGGASKSLDDELEEWTRRVVKTGDGTLVASPGTSVTRLDLEGGTVKLATSAPANSVSSLELATFASGTALDLSGKSYALTEIKGSPTVLNASTFTLNGSWTLLGVDTMAVSGKLVFGANANIALANAALFEDVNHAGVAIATATGGITGLPTIAGDDFELRLSSDGKSLLLCSTIPDEPDWTAFSKSFTITFNGYGCSSTLVDFPVLVRLAPGSIGGFKYSDFRKPNGDDLRFSDAVGNLIPHEIDTWNPSGESTVWVRVPALAQGTQITAHYSCARPVRALDAKSVWSNGYAGVWHLGEGAPPLGESGGTSTAFASAYGAGIGYAADGVVSGAVDFGDTGGGRRLDAADHDSLDGFDAFSVEMWTYQTKRLASGDRALGLLAKRNKYNDQMSYYLNDNGSNLVFTVTSDGTSGTVKPVELLSPSLNMWQHVAFVYDSAAESGQCVKGYLEGLFVKAGGRSAGRIFAGSGDLHLGCLGIDDSRNFPGRIDEVRISRVARSADWVRASHDTVADASFATCSRVVSTAMSEDSRLVVYPEYPAQIERDYAYAVSVTQGDTTTNLVVYNHSEKSSLTSRTRGGDVNRRFCEFAFAGDPVRVDIRVCEDVRAYKLFPARLRLQSSFDRENGVISVWVDTPHSFGLQLNDYDKTILSVFVDEPEDPADVPDRNDPTVLFVDGWTDPQDMATGVTTIDSSSPYTSMYIAPGAVFNSRLYLGKRYFRVHGRGMILDPFTDIFRFDHTNNRTAGVLVVQMQDQLVEDVKLVDARTYNFISYHSGCTFRNVKALSAMMCSDGMTCGAPGFKLEKAWLYVGDNALVISGLTDGIFRDVTLGTSCKAIYVQSSKNTNVRLEDVDAFRCDEGIISNSEPVQNNGESQHSFFFRNLSGVDCTLFPWFFRGINQGTLPKTFGFENVCVPQTTGDSKWNTIGQSGVAVVVKDSAGKPWTTCNYTLAITNLWFAGMRSNGFADGEIENPDRISISVVNNLAAPKIPAVPNRTEVNWTCPWKRYIGASLQRDVRLATREAGEQRLVEPDPHANLVADRNATKSVWQRCPSYKIKLDAMTFDTDGARIYRTREMTDSGRGIYCDVTDGFLRRGNGTYRLAFDVRPLLTNGVDTATIKAQILSNDKTSTVSFSVPNDGEWHRCETDFNTSFDIDITDLMGLHIFTSLSNAAEIDYKNISFVKWSPEMELPESERILYVPVAAGATNTLDATLVTSYITNIVKQGAGTLVMSAISGYSGTITVEGGVLRTGASANDLGAAGTVVDVLDGTSLALCSDNGAKPVANLLSGKTVNLYGAKNAAMVGKVQTFGSGTAELGENVNINLKDSDSTLYFASLAWDTGSIKSGAVDLGGRTLAIKSEYKRIQLGVRFFGGGTVDLQTTSLHVESMVPTFSGTGTIKANYSLNFTVPISAPGWTINGTGAQIRGIVNRWPSDVDYPAWEGPIALAGNSTLAAYAGTSEGKSNHVFNVKGTLSGGGNLGVGPGWLNLHGAANTYAGKVTVTGQVVDKATILPGGGGIGLWNGATCFPNASSITFTNTARLAFMDKTACTVPKVKFIALAGETQSISGGVHTARSTIAGITKTGAGTLLVDSPVQVAGLADIQAGTLKLANRANAQGQTNAEALAPMPVFASLSFASGTTLDLSDTMGYQVADIAGSPVIANAGLFGVTGKWTLASPSDVLDVSGENPTLVANNAAGLLAFAEGATFGFKNAATETAYSNAVVAAGSSGIVVARARGVMSGVNLGEVNLAMPQPSGTSSPRWQMRVADNNTTVRLFLVPEGGYAAWVAEKGIDGSPDAKYNGIERGVRYAFDIDPASSTVGEPIIKVVRDAKGNPVVQSRELAEGRDDVTFGVLATENLIDWSNATLVPMKKFETDGLWKPTASESSSYVFPAKMFFKYTVEVK